MEKKMRIRMFQNPKMNGIVMNVWKMRLRFKRDVLNIESSYKNKKIQFTLGTLGEKILLLQKQKRNPLRKTQDLLLIF